MGERRLRSADALYYHYGTPCTACGGAGSTVRPTPVGEYTVACSACGGGGEVWRYRTPTPADLLTDPRVWAAVEALRHERAHRRNLAERGVGSVPAALDEALAPFEEVPRG